MSFSLPHVNEYIYNNALHCEINLISTKRKIWN
jgi:hypothetical protein